MNCLTIRGGGGGGGGCLRAILPELIVILDTSKFCRKDTGNTSHVLLQLSNLYQAFSKKFKVLDTRAFSLLPARMS